MRVCGRIGEPVWRPFLFLFVNELPVHVFCLFFYEVLGLCFCQFLRFLKNSLGILALYL